MRNWLESNLRGKYYVKDSFNSKRGKDIRVRGDDFRGQRGSDTVDQSFFIIKINGGLEGFKDLKSLVKSDLETFRDDGRMDSLIEEDLASTQQSTGNNDDSGGTITSFDILRLGNIDELIYI